MRSLTVTAVAMLALTGSLVSVSSGGVRGRNRFHLLDRRTAGRAGRSLRERLTPVARERVSAVGRFEARYPDGRISSGTATLVANASASSPALVVTNAHVAEDLAIAGRRHTKVRFRLASGVEVAARIIGVVASERDEDDHAVLAVRLPRGARLTPVPLSTRWIDPGGRLYTSGFDNLRLLAPGSAYDGYDRTARDARMLAALRAPAAGIDQNVQTGTILTNASFEPGALLVEGKRNARSILRILTDLGALPGGSGSPLLAAEDHTMRGFVFATSPRSFRRDELRDDVDGHIESGTFAIPVSVMLQSLSDKLDRGEIAPRYVEAVENLILGSE